MRHFFLSRIQSLYKHRTRYKNFYYLAINSLLIVQIDSQLKKEKKILKVAILVMTIDKLNFYSKRNKANWKFSLMTNLSLHYIR